MPVRLLAGDHAAASAAVDEVLVLAASDAAACVEEKRSDWVSRQAQDRKKVRGVATGSISLHKRIDSSALVAKGRLID